MNYQNQNFIKPDANQSYSIKREIARKIYCIAVRLGLPATIFFDKIMQRSIEIEGLLEYEYQLLVRCYSVGFLDEEDMMMMIFNMISRAL